MAAHELLERDPGRRGRCARRSRGRRQARHPGAVWPASSRIGSSSSIRAFPALDRTTRRPTGQAFNGMSSTGRCVRRGRPTRPDRATRLPSAEWPWTAAVDVLRPEKIVALGEVLEHALGVFAAIHGEQNLHCGLQSVRGGIRRQAHSPACRGSPASSRCERLLSMRCHRSLAERQPRCLCAVRHVNGIHEDTTKERGRRAVSVRFRQRCPAIGATMAPSQQRSAPMSEQSRRGFAENSTDAACGRRQDAADQGEEGRPSHRRNGAGG